MGTPRLFPLPLRGVGTAEVEAFSSYLQRLAIAHGVSIWKLLERIRSWHHHDYPGFKDCLEGAFSSPDLSVFVRPNNTTYQIITMLEHVTGNHELRCGTFVSLMDALDRSAGVFAGRPRWCPACIAEFERADDTGYLKLSWLLKLISHCPTHGVPLGERCPECDALQRTTSFEVNFTRCGTCKAPLSATTSTDEPPSSWMYQGADLVQLVETIASDGKLVFPAAGVRRVIAAIFDKVWTEVGEIRFWKILPRDECISIADGTLPITLATARKLAFRLGVSLPDLLMGKYDMTSGVLDPAWTSELPKDMQPKRRRKRRDRDEILKKLKEVTSRHKTQPLSLKQVARTVEVSVGCLEYHFPAQSREIITKYKAWRIEQQNRKRIQARAAAMAFFTSKQSQKPKSRKEALRTLRAQTGLPKNVLREAIAVVSKIVVTINRDRLNSLKLIEKL